MFNGYGMRKFDDEGVLMREMIIIENGIFRMFFFNMSFVRKYGIEIIVNVGLVMLYVWNIVFEFGDYLKEEFFSEVKKGIYIINVWYMCF